MSRRRLLLVEDDASIRRLVSMALEDCGLELVAAPGLASAFEALRGPPFELVLCDLTLPDGHGLELLRALAGPDSPSPGARRVAFSAGVSAAVRAELLQAGVHEVLSKPTSMANLEACVARALAAPAATAAPAAAVHESPPAAAAVPAALALFGGDRPLYLAFLAQCRPQFGRDAAAGDLAAGQFDLPALQRLAHSLKSVLLTLGFDSDSQLAARVEAAATEQRADDAWSLWPTLRARLQAQAEPGQDAAGSMTQPG